MISRENETNIIAPALFGPRNERDYGWSGLERNHVFVSNQGKAMLEASYHSGADAIGDGRTVALADFDRDGDEDLVVMSRNTPIFRLYENHVADRIDNDFVGLVIEGDGRRGSRDAIGAIVNLSCSGRKIRRDVVSGVGFGAQNARTLTIGLGRCPTVDISVKFGDTTVEAKGLSTRRLYRVHQRGDVGEIAKYVPRRAPAPPPPPVDAPGAIAAFAKEGIRTYVTFWASWCHACKELQPRLNALARRYAGRVRFVGVSLDARDDASKVAYYQRWHEPAYEIHAGDERVIGAVTELFAGTLPPLPSGALLDGSGRVLWRGPGVIDSAALFAKSPPPAPPTTRDGAPAKIDDAPTSRWLTIGVLTLVLVVFLLTRRRKSP